MLGWNFQEDMLVRNEKGNKMNRLTKRFEHENADGIKYLPNNQEMVFETLNKLGELEDLEEQGLLLRLPCKIGETVYQIMVAGINESKKIIYRVYEAKVFKYSLDSITLCFWTETKDKFKYKYEIAISEFGKTVFLTKEEAEKALAEMGCE